MIDFFEYSAGRFTDSGKAGRFNKFANAPNFIAELHRFVNDTVEESSYVFEDICQPKILLNKFYFYRNTEGYFVKKNRHISK